MAHRTTASPTVRARVEQTFGATTTYFDAPYAVLVCGVVASSAFVSYLSFLIMGMCTYVGIAMGSIRPEMYNPRNHRCVGYALGAGSIKCSLFRNGGLSSEGEARKTSEKSYELCAGAANHITSIGNVLLDS